MKKTKWIALLLSLVLCFSFCACGNDEPAEQEEPAAEPAAEMTPAGAMEDAADYLVDTVVSVDSPQLGCDWVVLGLARSGCEVPNGYFDAYYDAFASAVASAGGILDESKYTEYSRSIIMLTAIGKDPQNCGGYNLLTPLADFDKTTVQGLNGAIWALIALNCGDYTLPENPAAATQASEEMYLEKLLSGQAEDGSFSLAGGDGDVDITAMTLQALAFYKDREDVSPVIEKALNWLSGVQQADGAFMCNGEETSESTSQVMTALASLGIAEDDSRFVNNGSSVFDGLMVFRCDNGSFMHTVALGEGNGMATEQAFYALTAMVRAERGESALYDMTE